MFILGSECAYNIALTWIRLISVFNFTNGDQDVAQVTREAFRTCNTTNPISLKKTSPANFTLDAAGEYYFTSTVDQHCLLGQKLAIYVSGPGPSPSSAPKPRPRGPLNFTVGERLGWMVPPGGELAYAVWAHGKTFIVGDALGKNSKLIETLKTNYQKLYFD